MIVKGVVGSLTSLQRKQLQEAIHKVLRFWPPLFLLYTDKLPEKNAIFIGQFSDYTAILVRANNTKT